MFSAYTNTYAEAREKFLAVASERDAAVVSVVQPSERGVQGEDLAIDFAKFGDFSAEKPLLLVSGTHGLEGYTGSAIQIAFLRDIEIPEGVNIIAVHALNPWGFSHLSRTDESNIDINRNFYDLAAPLPENDLYPILHQAWCPDDWTDEVIDWSATRDDLIGKHGVKRFMTAMTGGQFDEPTGLNFGGRAFSWSRSVVELQLPRLLKRARKIAFIEWHTGIGAYGELSHLCFFEPGSEAYERVFSWMGEEARSTLSKGMGFSGGQTATYSGLFSMWLPGVAPDAEWAGLVIEVGTYDLITGTDALRVDRWLRFGRGRSSLSREAMRHTMLEWFYPSDSVWRAAALRNGLDAQARALEGLRRW